MCFTQLCLSKFSKCLWCAECASAVCANTAVGHFPFPAQCTSTVLTHTTVCPND